jgi:hypothetical protein
MVRRMIRDLEVAIEKLKGLSENSQAYAARVIEGLAASHADMWEIPGEGQHGLGRVELGKPMSDEEKAKLWRRWGV